MGWFFRRKKEEAPHVPPVADFSFLGADMHSHLIPGVDDGAETMADSLALIRSLKSLGYSKLITTPHVYVEFYNNEFSQLRRDFDVLQRAAADAEPDVTLGLAAEYNLDEFFLKTILPQGLLSFGDEKYVLVEVSMAGWPRQFHDALFEIQSRGYTPVLAHPERYQYETSPDVFLKLKERGVLMQMNLLSPGGYYGRGVREAAKQFMQLRLYDFCGSDMHHLRHADGMDDLRQKHPDIMQVLAAYGFKNEQLLAAPDNVSIP